MKNSYFEKTNKGTGNQEDLAFMSHCKKGEISEILNKPCHILGYGFGNGENGFYSIVRVDIAQDKFFCCGKVVTNKLQKIDDDGHHADLKEEEVEFVLRDCKGSDNKYLDMEIR